MKTLLSIYLIFFLYHQITSLYKIYRANLIINKIDNLFKQVSDAIEDNRYVFENSSFDRGDERKKALIYSIDLDLYDKVISFMPEIKDLIPNYWRSEFSFGASIFDNLEFASSIKNELRMFERNHRYIMRKALFPSFIFKSIFNTPSWFFSQIGFKFKEQTKTLINFFTFVFAGIQSLYNEEIKNFISVILENLF